MYFFCPYYMLMFALLNTVSNKLTIENRLYEKLYEILLQA